MLKQSLKKLVRMHDPIFVATADPKVFDVQVVPYFVKQGKEIALPPVMIARAKIVDDAENSDTHFSTYNSETCANDTIYVVFV